MGQKLSIYDLNWFAENYFEHTAYDAAARVASAHTTYLQKQLYIHTRYNLFEIFNPFISVFKAENDLRDSNVHQLLFLK